MIHLGTWNTPLETVHVCLFYQNSPIWNLIQIKYSKWRFFNWIFYALSVFQHCLIFLTLGETHLAKVIHKFNITEQSNPSLLSCERVTSEQLNIPLGEYTVCERSRMWFISSGMESQQMFCFFSHMHNFKQRMSKW